jgi:KUP system potassium uptake protein
MGEPRSNGPAPREARSSLSTIMLEGKPKSPNEARGLRLAGLCIGAIGVVYGDIGTSPLYAIRECFAAGHGVEANPDNVYGVLSLFFWSLLIVVVVKYLVYMLRADNEGEGGILALLALVAPRSEEERSRAGKWLLLMFGLFGAALLYGDGAITPAISVLSAVEGLEVATDAFSPWVIPITCLIIFALFAVQKWGTGKVGVLFGPGTLVWFVAIGYVGLQQILREPGVLYAMSPHHAVRFFVVHIASGSEEGLHAFLLLGSVFLCVTGGEALYADMGHFGRKAIRIAWFVVAYPALLLNYFGQGAALLGGDPEVVANPFYAIVPRAFLYPMVGLATFATVVASQALISGAFSISRQAVQLGYFPRVTIIHTSGHAEGQIYIPEVNWLLMVACIALVLGFRSSSALAAAYGIAVTGTMAVTSILFFAAMRSRIGNRKAGALLVLFLIFDLAFLIANSFKIEHGGWFPLAAAAAIFIVMTTWNRGRVALAAYVRDRAKPLADFVAEIEQTPPIRVPGTAIVMTANANVAPPVLLHHLKHNRTMHERVILLSAAVQEVPEVPPDKRLKVEQHPHGITHVLARYGFMQTPNVPEILARLAEKGVPVELARTTFFLGRETLLVTGPGKLARWRKRLFAFLSRNSRPPTHYFEIPPDRVVEIGMQIEL